MFNIFKQKVEIKSNIKFMQSVQNKSIKVGSSITVPENFLCLIYHNSKFYNCLEAGSYQLDEDLCPKLFKNQRRNGKLKKLSLICHYINIAPSSFTFKYKKNEITVDFEIISPRNFAEFILLYSYKTDDIYAQECVKDCLVSYIKLLDNSNLQILNNALEIYGIKLSGVSFLSSATSIKQNTDLDLLPTQQNKSYPTSNLGSNTSTLSNQNSNLPTGTTNGNITVCPNCKTQFKFSTTFCVRCGYKLK